MYRERSSRELRLPVRHLHRHPVHRHRRIGKDGAGLALEEAGADYRDITREDGIDDMMAGLDAPPRPAFAPPYLRDGDLVVGQTAAILHYLGPRLGLVGESEADRIWTHQIQLTIADAVAEAHDSHHPIASSLTYADQTREAARR